MTLFCSNIQPLTIICRIHIFLFAKPSYPLNWAQTKNTKTFMFLFTFAIITTATIITSRYFDGIAFYLTFSSSTRPPTTDWTIVGQNFGKSPFPFGNVFRQSRIYVLHTSTIIVTIFVLTCRCSTC